MYCHLCKQELALDEHFSAILHTTEGCIQVLLEKIEGLESRVDDLESKEEARRYSEHGPEYY